VATAWLAALRFHQLSNAKRVVREPMYQVSTNFAKQHL
jgi:hypothetical protein